MRLTKVIDIPIMVLYFYLQKDEYDEESRQNSLLKLIENFRRR